MHRIKIHLQNINIARRRLRPTPIALAAEPVLVSGDIIGALPPPVGRGAFDDSLAGRLGREDHPAERIATLGIRLDEFHAVDFLHRYCYTLHNLQSGTCAWL